MCGCSFAPYQLRALYILADAYANAMGARRKDIADSAWRARSYLTNVYELERTVCTPAPRNIRVDRTS